jgi:hypothetical protein
MKSFITKKDEIGGESSVTSTDVSTFDPENRKETESFGF